jgi:signal transduction histidine kinase/ActR/RegA family two-component response regulator
VFAVDDELRIVAANQSARSALDSEQLASLLGELETALRQCLASGTPQRVELGRNQGHGTWDLECLPLGHAGERLCLALMHDAQERQALHRALERTSRSEALGKLAGSIAHDFNNLLTGMRGSIALARQNRSDQSREAALQAADTAAQRAGEMTRQLLAFSRGPAVVAPRADVQGVLSEATALLSCLPDGARVELALVGDLGRVELTAAELHQVVLNLLMNARDAVKALGPLGRVTLHATRCAGAPDPLDPLDPLRYGPERAYDSQPSPSSSKRPSRWVRVTVTDNGAGIEPAIRQRIFEPFFTTKSGHEGTGLGLSSVRDIVERAGGWIDVQSEPQRGATFSVYLPFVPEGPGMNVEPARPPPVKQVLICDDESRLASLTAGLLKEFGYESLAVGAGEEALELLRSRSTDVGVLLLDVNLAAGVSAHEILQAMKAEGLSSPVILTSGFAPEDLPDSLKSHDCVASYLPKPYTVTELVSAIKRALSDGPRDG